jgi:hypothetical protein
MIRFPKAALSLTLSLALGACAASPEFHEAQNLSAQPFNQLDLAGNACGPAAFLNSCRFGSPAWRKVSETPADLSDRERIRAIARGPAMRESSSLPGRARWSRSGINLSDLRDVANEMRRPHSLPMISEQTLFLKPGESQQAHARRVRSLLARSLDAGFPPILSIRRYVKRNGNWTAVQGHFVTITSVPGNIAPTQGSFAVNYIDPWGGRFREGKISISSRPFLAREPANNPNLEADFPDVTVGKRFVRSGEESILVASALLGRL